MGRRVAMCLVAAAGLGGCLDTVLDVAFVPTDGRAGGGGTGTGGQPVPTEVSPCAGKVYACGDLVDNDGDGLIDAQDPSCLGPCDNTEDSLFGGIPGQNQAPCRQDCYWDDDTGSGNDQCFWDHRCDPLSVPPNYFPEPSVGDACAYDEDANLQGTNQSCAELSEAQSDTCSNTCLPLTPNGCDCFGCCERPGGGFVYVGSLGLDGSTLCTLDALDDPNLCHPCTPVPGCQNDCGRCEYCLGKTVLPDDCDPTGEGGGPTEAQCPPELTPCGGPGQAVCPSETYCLTGCCVPVVK